MSEPTKTAVTAADRSGTNEIAQSNEANIRHSALDVGLAGSTGLSVHDLRKSFYSPNGERLEVLRGVSFSVHPGESIAIVGTSGAGKSTLLNLLGGLEVPDHGSISIGGIEVNVAKPTALAQFRNLKLGLVFQFHHLLPDLTAAENVALPLMIRRISHANAISQAIGMLRSAGLADRVSHQVSRLSGGEQQRVAVCRALVGAPSLVLADEPTGNLDVQNSDAIAESLTLYAGKHRAIVIIATHNPRVASLCDRTFFLREGRMSTS